MKTTGSMHTYKDRNRHRRGKSTRVSVGQLHISGQAPAGKAAKLNRASTCWEPLQAVSRFVNEQTFPRFHKGVSSPTRVPPDSRGRFPTSSLPGSNWQRSGASDSAHLTTSTLLGLLTVFTSKSSGKLHLSGLSFRTAHQRKHMGSHSYGNGDSDSSWQMTRF